MLLVKNRKALHNYEIIEKYVAGIVLKGYEVKAIREKKVSFEGAYIKSEDGELYVVNLHIGLYSKRSQRASEIDEKRKRKILLSRKEIEEIIKQIDEKGKTAVPIALVLRNNLIKLEIAVVRGRKKHEKKQVAKKRQIEKDLRQRRKDLGIR